MEQARWEIFRELKLFEYFKEYNLKSVVIELHVRYSKEAKIFDDLIIKTTLKKESPYLVFLHKIYNKNNNIRLCKAEVKTLLINNENIPGEIPDNYINEIIGSKNQQNEQH